MASAEPVVQVNVYGTTLADMLHNGVNLPHILSMHGYKDCVIFDVPQRKQKKRTRRSSIDSDDDMASLSSDDEEQMKEARHRPQEKPHPRRSLLNCSLSTISGSGNHFQNPEAVPFDEERVKTEEASPEPEERETREDRDEHCGENEEEEDLLADSDRNGSQDERVDSFEREDGAGVDLLDTALLPPSEEDLTLSFNASVADCLLDIVEQVCASCTPALLPSYEASTLEGSVFCEPIAIDSCDASGSREISRLSRKRPRRGLSPPSRAPSASRTLPITRNLAPSVVSWYTAPQRLTPVASELQAGVSHSKSVLEEEGASGAVPAQEIGPNGEDSRLLHGFMGGELGFFDEFPAGPVGNPSDNIFTSSPSIFPNLDFSFYSNAYDDPLDDDLAMLYTSKEQAAAEVALDEEEERPHEEIEDGDEFYDCCSAGEEDAAEEGIQGDYSIEEEEAVVESSGEEEEEDAGSHNESLVKKKKMRIYSLEGKKFFCQYKYCNKSIVWRKGYGSNRFLTHVRTHFNRSVYKCALCQHKDLHEFKIRYHHRKNHDGLPWTAPLNVENKEDVEELLKLWEQCFPDRNLVPPFSLLKS